MVEAWVLVGMFAAVLAALLVVLWVVVGLSVRAGPAAVRVAGQVVLIASVIAVAVVVLVMFGPAALAQVLEAFATARL